MELLLPATSEVCGTNRQERVRKPDQLNFARVCLWCGERDCASPRCIELHARSRWMICDECHGFSAGDCLCVHGVVEATPAGAAATD